MWSFYILFVTITWLGSFPHANGFVDRRRSALYSNSSSSILAPSTISTAFSTEAQSAFPSVSSSSISQSSSIGFSSTLDPGSSSKSLAPSNASITAPAACTGCVLEAVHPVTLSYSAPLNVSTTIIGTVFVSIITYEDGSVTTTSETSYNSGSTPTLPPNQTDVHLTITWTWDEAPHVIL